MRKNYSLPAYCKKDGGTPYKTLAHKATALLLAGAMALTGAMPVFADTVDSGEYKNQTTIGTVGATETDIIDYSSTGSLTIYKYDETSASKDGITWNNYSNGEKNEEVEKTLAPYAIKGVVFDRLWVGDAYTYQTTTVDNETGDTKNTVEVLYGLTDASLAEAIGLHAEVYLDTDDDNIIGTTDSNGNYDNSTYYSNYADAVEGGYAITYGESGSSGKAEYYYTASEITTAVSNALKSNNTETKNTLEKYIKNAEESNSDHWGRFEETDENGMTTDDDLDLGLYLIVETYVPEDVQYTTNPFFVTLPMTDDSGEDWFYDLYCYPKNQTDYPTIDKLVSDNDNHSTDYNTASEQMADTTSASEGDTVDFMVMSQVPNITSEATRFSKWVYQDHLSAAFTYGKDMKLAIYASSEAAAAKINDTTKALVVADAEGTTFNYDNTTSAVMANNGATASGSETVNDKPFFTLEPTEYSSTYGTYLKFSLTETGLAYLNGTHSFNTVNENATLEDGSNYKSTDVVGCSDYYVVIYYTTTLNSDETTVLGDEGNPNDVYLSWSRSSNGYTDYIFDEAIVYAYGMDLTKEFEADSEGKTTAKPTDVEFTLSNDTEYEETETRDDDGEVSGYTSKPTQYYVVAKETGEDTGIYYVTGKTTKTEEATVFSCNSDSRLIIYGLEADTYTLTEVQTSDGYSLLRDPVTIEIEKTDTTIVPTLSYLRTSGTLSCDMEEVTSGDHEGQYKYTYTYTDENNKVYKTTLYKDVYNYQYVSEEGVIWSNGSDDYTFSEGNTFICGNDSVTILSNSIHNMTFALDVENSTALKLGETPDLNDKDQGDYESDGWYAGVYYSYFKVDDEAHAYVNGDMSTTGDKSEIASTTRTSTDADGNTLTEDHTGRETTMTETNYVQTENTVAVGKSLVTYGSSTTSNAQSDHSMVTLTVTNNLNSILFNLPKTGGAGMMAVTVIGIIAVLGGAMLMCGKKKGKEQQ